MTAPVLTSIDPTGAAIGDRDLTMTCTGTGFTPDSKITFNGNDEPTTLIGTTKATTIVKPETANVVGPVPVTVRNATGASAPQQFTFAELPENGAGSEGPWDHEYLEVWPFGHPQEPPAPPGPDKGAVDPGDVFPAEPTITASDSTNAAKLLPLGYIAAVGAVMWTFGQKMTVGTFDFYWAASNWAPGAKP